MQEKDGFAEFTVTDTGPGINAHVLPHLFEIQPAHGGQIQARNLPEGGALTFALPLGVGFIVGLVISYQRM